MFCTLTCQNRVVPTWTSVLRTGLMRTALFNKDFGDFLDPKDFLLPEVFSWSSGMRAIRQVFEALTAQGQKVINMPERIPKQKLNDG